MSIPVRILVAVVAVVVIAVVVFAVIGIRGGIGIDKRECIHTGGVWHGFPIEDCEYYSK